MKNKLIILILMLFSYGWATNVVAQELEDGTRPEYRRPNFKVYTSLEQALAYPDSVYILSLKGKKLTEWPAEISSFKNLLVLDLSKNKLSEIPSGIEKWVNLIELDLSNNKLKQLPQEISGMKSLRKLSLNRNTISELPESIGDMTSLEILELWDNEISELPSSIRNLKHLKILEMRGILFSEEQQQEFRELLPETRVMMSPSCNCKTR